MGVARIATRLLASATALLGLTAPAAATLRAAPPGLAPPTATLAFDAALGVHAVAGRHGVYFHDRSYLRIHRGTWQASATASGPWRPQPIHWVPFTLRVKHFVEER